MRTDESSHERLAAVADRLLAHPFQCWFYGDSVGFEGLLAASDLLGDNRWRDFSHGFFRAWGARREPWGLDDNTAPGHAMCAVVEATGDQLLKEAAVALGHQLSARRKVHGAAITFEDTLRSLRQPYGDVELSADHQEIMENPGAGVWLDCMHFDPPFYAHLAHLDEGLDWRDMAVSEILAYRDLLLNPSNGLYRHYWLERTQSAWIDGWARGQGWALLGLLDVAHGAIGHPRLDEVAGAALDLARVMVRLQRDDGHWWNMAHDPRSGEESSTAAFMATAFFRGMSNGILPETEFQEPADRAKAAMIDMLDNDGNLMGVSAAVMSALVDEHYWNVPLNKIVPWGQGPVLTAFAAEATWNATKR